MVSTSNAVYESYSPVVMVDHNVYVVEVPDKFTMLLRSPVRGTYRADFCRDYANETVLTNTNAQAGYMLDEFKFVSTGYGCWDVSHESMFTGPLGFWWHKENGVIVKVRATHAEKED